MPSLLYRSSFRLLQNIAKRYVMLCYVCGTVRCGTMSSILPSLCHARAFDIDSQLDCKRNEESGKNTMWRWPKDGRRIIKQFQQTVFSVLSLSLGWVKPWMSNGQWSDNFVHRQLPTMTAMATTTIEMQFFTVSNSTTTKEKKTKILLQFNSIVCVCVFATNDNAVASHCCCGCWWWHSIWR